MKIKKYKIDKEKRRAVESSFKYKFRDVKESKWDDFLNNYRERWTDEDVVIIFEYGLRLGKGRRK
jgi:hypothetical protein